MTLNDILSRLEGVSPGGNGFSAKCPAHDDKQNSLSVAAANDRILIKCHAGCEFNDIVKAMGLKPSDFFSEPTQGQPTRRLEKTYDYIDETGKLVYQVMRFTPKTFKQRQPNGKGDWLYNLQGVKRILYRLPDVLKAKGGAMFVVEGEKDADAMTGYGFTATTNAGGASAKWEPQFTEALAGCHIVIIADKDTPGRAHAKTVAGALHGKALSVKVLELPDTNGKSVKDAADFFAAGGTAAELRELVRNAHEWTPMETALQMEVRAMWNAPDMSLLDKKKAVAERVSSELLYNGRLYHTEDSDYASLMFFDTARKILLKINSDCFLSWFSMFCGVNRSENLYNYILLDIQDRALNQGERVTPEHYWAGRNERIYISCGEGRMARITSGSWDFADNGADGVLFPQNATLARWDKAEAADPFESCRLFRNASFEDQYSLDILRLWFLSMPTMQRAKPPLCLVGAPGSGKTRLMTGFSEIMGIPRQIFSLTENAESDFWASLNTGGLLVADNADSHLKWFANSVESYSTGAERQKRKLYTDSGMVSHKPNAWLAITSANPVFAGSPALADRVMVVRMRRLGAETADSELSAEIQKHRSSILTWTCDTLSKALADNKPVPGGLNRRHPDFASFAIRLGRAVGREQETVAALRSTESDKSRFNLENDSVGLAVMDICAKQPFKGTASQMLNLLREKAVFPHDVKFTPLTLGKRLEKIWPHIEEVFTARKGKNREGCIVYDISTRSAGDAGDQTAFSKKFPEKNTGRHGTDGALTAVSPSLSAGDAGDQTAFSKKFPEKNTGKTGTGEDSTEESSNYTGTFNKNTPSSPASPAKLNMDSQDEITFGIPNGLFLPGPGNSREKFPA